MENDRKICIRADGSPEIGLGHVVRCMSLAHMLTDDFSIHFYVFEIPDSLKNEINQNGWDVTVIEKESDFLNELTGNEIVVLDSYQFYSDYQKQLKDKGCKLVCIDDFHDQHFYADLVINHAPGVTKGHYDGELYTKYLLGPDYSLLRPEFLETKSYENKKISRDVKNIFVCFGGSDSKNLTAKVLSWLPLENYTVTLVLGNAYPHRDELNTVIEERKDLEIVVKNSLSAKEMSNELEQADLAIVPASGILFEVISTGLPVISGYYTENQQNVYSGFKANNVFYDAKSFNEQDFLKAFSIAIKKKDDEIVENQQNCVDGLSPKRFRSKFLGLLYSNILQIREADIDDMEQYFKWANDESVRANAFNTEDIPWNDHVTWFKKKLSNNHSRMYIFEIDDRGVGQVRFDKENEEVWDIDYMLDEDFRGFGLGSEIIDRGLKKLIFEEKRVKVQALVKTDNIPSEKVFEDLNFKKHNFKEGTIKFTYEEKI
ncbi:UDP-2,4-diacetamido-2,4,6-trideoxy-beta-L-altropyranose hydrolase [Gracilimonas sp.]|uniref:UDP-2,4-diacetamido-2,4, 6-trideoxy-beta-L-altropyranose hydrolase n=1 Tax=Gracilimonas sp. TaxID=1974203 RepID=UPI003D104E8F